MRPTYLQIDGMELTHLLTLSPCYSVRSDGKHIGQVWQVDGKWWWQVWPNWPTQPHGGKSGITKTRKAAAFALRDAWVALAKAKKALAKARTRFNKAKADLDATHVRQRKKRLPVERRWCKAAKALNDAYGALSEAQGGAA